MLFLTYLYTWITKFRNFLYDKGILKIKRVEGAEVICIGNITVGGTGKTPAVQYFAKKYLSEGKKVAIVSRGYGGKREKEPLLVSDGNEILASVKESGDESYLHALKLKNIPIVVGKDRFLAAKFAKDRFNVDIIIMDDGFQHRRLYRDKNIVLVDATNPFGGEQLLPKGRLREDLSGLNRADEFIVTKSNMAEKKVIKDIMKKLESYNKKISLEEHLINSFYCIDGEEKDINFLKDKKVLLFSGLANPWQFEDSVKKLGVAEIISKNYKDHYSYSRDDIEEILEFGVKERVDLIVTTEKDLVKIPKDFKNKLIYILGIEFKIIK